MLGKVGDTSETLTFLLTEKLLTTKESLVGKTIQSVYSSKENLVVLVLFTDGTFCLLESDDYECRDYINFISEISICTGYSTNLEETLIKAGLLSQYQIDYVKVVEKSRNPDYTLKLLREEFSSLANEFGELE